VDVLAVVGALSGSVVDSSFGLRPVGVRRNVTFVDWVTDDVSTTEGVDAVVVVCSLTSEVGNDSGTVEVLAVVGAMSSSVVDSSFGLWSVEVRRNVTFVGWVTDDVSTREGVDARVFVRSVVCGVASCWRFVDVEAGWLAVVVEDRETAVAAGVEVGLSIGVVCVEGRCTAVVSLVVVVASTGVVLLVDDFVCSSLTLVPGCRDVPEVDSAELGAEGVVVFSIRPLLMLVGGRVAVVEPPEVAVV
jgi:hypothetical protein